MGYIRAEEAMLAIDQEWPEKKHDPDMERIRDKLYSISASDVRENVFATFIDWYGDYKCSNCDAEIKSEIMYMCDHVNYCPCCGAVLKGENDEYESET